MWIFNAIMWKLKLDISCVHKYKTNWQGDKNLVNCALCYIIGQCLPCYGRHQKGMNRVGSVDSLTLPFLIIQYFLINKGISVTSDIKKMSCLFNDFGLKCLLRDTDMHEIAYTFLFLSFFFPPQSNLHCTNLAWTVYKYMSEGYLFLAF